MPRLLSCIAWSGKLIRWLVGSLFYTLLFASCKCFLYAHFQRRLKGSICVLALADIQWVPEDRVTLFTSDGLVQIGGSLVPRRVSSSEVLNLQVEALTLTNISC